MSYKGIIFDKDGTLFDYYTIWAPVFKTTIKGILENFDRGEDADLERDMLHMLGLGLEGVNPRGLIFKHRKPFMLLYIYRFSRKHKLPFAPLVKAFENSYYDGKDYIKASLIAHTDENDLLPLFEKLQKHGYRIGIATSDNKESTLVCLEHFHLIQFIDMISTNDDHFKRKPSPESFVAFCKKFSLLPEEVVVVGDATMDLAYAKRGKAGYRVGVLTGSKDVKRLSKLAHILYPSVHELIHDPKLFP